MYAGLGRRAPCRELGVVFPPPEECVAEEWPQVFGPVHPASAGKLQATVRFGTLGKMTLLSLFDRLRDVLVPSKAEV